MRPHLLIACSSHGYGHIGQCAPVVRALHAQIPGLRVTLRTRVPRFKLVERFGADVVIDAADTDVGMLQADAQRILFKESAEAYARFHADWTTRVEDEARCLRALTPDLVLANVPYLALAAAARAGIPAVGLCSINWMEIYEYFFSGRPEAPPILAEMREAYHAAQVFLRPAPGMRMAGLENVRDIAPIADTGRSRRVDLAEIVGAAPDERIIMISIGGMDLRPPVEAWGPLPGLKIIAPAAWNARHSQIVALESLAWPYMDVLWSCDALICKPGYGSFVEASTVGLPVLYLERPDWPEISCLVSWLEAHGRCDRLEDGEWRDGRFTEKLNRLWATDGARHVSATGADDAAGILATYL